VSNGGSATFADRDDVDAVCWARASRTVASLSNELSLDVGVSLVSSSPRSRLILALAAASSVWGLKY
jgi:hypothetical protein